MSRTGESKCLLCAEQCMAWDKGGRDSLSLLETSSVRYRNYRKPQTEQLRHTGSKASVVRQDQQNLYKEEVKPECYGISPESG